jgi:hypothetical protein
METDLISNFSRVLAVHLKHLPVSHIAATFKHMEATSVFSLKVRHNFVKKLDMISHNSSRNIRPRVRVVSGMVVHGMRMQRVLLQAVLSVVIILLPKSEPAALPDQHGIHRKSLCPNNLWRRTILLCCSEKMSRRMVPPVTTTVCNNDGVCSGEESCQCADCVTVVEMTKTNVVS